MRRNITEMIVISDKAVLNALQVGASFASSDLVYNSTERNLSADLKRLGDLAVIPLSNLTLYALRRGGATNDFQQHFSMARTMKLGRWSAEKTARRWHSRQRPR